MATTSLSLRDSAHGWADTGAEPDSAIEVRGLTKIYRPTARDGAVRALDAIDLAIPRGCIFGLLGPNGAGKSTLINILAGLVVKSAGQVRVWRYDIDENPRMSRAMLGIVPQELMIDPFFTPREIMELQAGLFGVPARERRTLEILKALGLGDKANAWSRSLSGGMRRRLMVAKALVHRPPILVLDEPTAGVDVELRRQLWSYVRELNAGGTTILLTTHYLEEAEQMCDRIAIIDRGHVVANDTTKALVRRLDTKMLVVTLAGDIDRVPEALAPLGFERHGERQIRLGYRPSQTQIGPLLAAIGAAGLSIVDVSTEEADLEDLFVALTRSAGRVGQDNGPHA